MQTPLSFQEALAQSEGNRSLLLGNGFSRACRNDLFAYDALYEEATDQLNSTILAAFKALGTTDFEKVMRALKLAELLVNTYSINNSSLNELASSFANDADSLREILAKVIASNHPERMNEISDDRFRNCRAFLSNFSKIYTLNYDLLLYWALMKDDIDDLTIKRDDGFRHPEDGEKDYVMWDYIDSGNQNVFYMHGALHIFDADGEVQKYTWSNTGIALMDQILEALNENRYPIYVSEAIPSLN